MLACCGPSLAAQAHDQDDGEDHQAAEDVQGVEAGHGEVARRPQVAERDRRRQVRPSVLVLRAESSLTSGADLVRAAAAGV